MTIIWPSIAWAIPAIDIIDFSFRTGTVERVCRKLFSAPLACGNTSVLLARKGRVHRKEVR